MQKNPNSGPLVLINAAEAATLIAEILAEKSVFKSIINRHGRKWFYFFTDFGAFQKLKCYYIHYNF